MPSIKRALKDIQQPAASRRVRLSEDELDLLEKHELIAKINALEDELEKVKYSTRIGSLSSAGGNAAAMSDEQIKEKVRARKLMVKGIKSQMKVRLTYDDKLIPERANTVVQWKPACKIENAKFSFSGALPSTHVFNALTAQPTDARKSKKMIQFSLEEFTEKVASENIGASVRYDRLSITSKTVNMHWREEDQTFTVTGSYGKASLAYQTE